MEYKVMIDAFEGPLDLLLHLIKKTNINICDINIVDITKQYLDYIKCMEEMNLDIASEYLTMAAELIEMKSKILLPIKESDEIEEERQDLINRLLDYQQYKEVITQFRNLEQDRKEEFTKNPEDLKKYGCTSEIHLNDLTLDDLINAFNKFIENKEKEKPLNTKIATKEYSVSKRSNEIKDIIKKRKIIEFQELFEEYNKSYIVVTFLAILDLTKKRDIKIKQENNFNKIYIEDVS